jgi:hypothetical protein
MEAAMHTTRSSSLAAFLALGSAALLVAALVAALALLTALPAHGAPAPDAPVHGAVVQDWCDDSRAGARDHCEVRALAAGLAGGAFAVEGMTNGSIRVEGWDGSEVRVMARVTARNAGSAAEAIELADEVRLDASTGLLQVEGPRSRLFQRASWSVDLRIQVPAGAELALGTTNGSIEVARVGGAVRARSTNGNVAIEGASSWVEARTTNGSVRVGLTGAAPSPRLDLRTTNGSVELSLPADASLRVDAATTNGRITSDFALETEGRRQNRARGVLGTGAGEAVLRATNGSLRINRAGGAASN